MTEREKLLRESIRTITKDRQDIYGNPEDNFELIGALWNLYLTGRKGNATLYLTSEDVAIMMALMKVARITTGERKIDNFVDLCGYGALAYEMAVKDGLNPLPDKEKDVFEEPGVAEQFAKAHECCGGRTNE